MDSNSSIGRRKKKWLKIATCISFLILPLFPMLKENLSSISIIICAFFVFINYIYSKKGIELNKNQLFLTLPFWMFLLHEVLTGDFNVNRVLLYLPFLIFPLLFIFKPYYIDEKIKKYSLFVFQIAVIFSSCYFLLLFLNSNTYQELFTISLENIPFFRDYIFRNAALHIHPTYFSSFLLISFSLSLYNIFRVQSISLILDLLNSIFTVFMLFLFSSRISIVAFLITLVIITLFLLRNIKRKKRILYFSVFAIIGIVIIFPFKEILVQRFDEVIKEYKKPVIGNRHNSTNIRVAVLQCSLSALKELPFIGYGDNLQNVLDECYLQKFDSNFSLNTKYNTHNYYLNLILYGGILFLLLFISYLIGMFLMLKHSFLAILIISQLLIINFTENYFSRHYGIVNFNYFLCLFIFFKNNHVNRISD